MEMELLSHFDWYQEHLPTLCLNYNIERFLEILQNPLETAPSRLYYPMPGGTALIANTYNQPVIFYTKMDIATMLTFPFFTPRRPQSEISPIIIGHVRGNHYVSLQLNLSPSLPIPFLNDKWPTLRSKQAEGWSQLYDSNCLIFLKVARELRALRYKRLKERIGETDTIPVVNLVSDDDSGASDTSVASGLSQTNQKKRELD